jgi:hypothetical protein
MRILEDAIAREKPSKVCVVGDFTALKTIEYNIFVDLYIIDNQVMRQPIEVTFPERVTVFRSHNSPGTITLESWDLLKRIVDADSRAVIVVEGEEDLLTLAVIKFAPKNAFVIYGQPHVGLVLVRVTDEKKKEIDVILDMMRTEEPIYLSR